MIRIKLKDREGLRSFLIFLCLGKQPEYFDDLMVADRVFTVTKMTRTHFELDNGLYNLNKHNFWRYFEREQASNEEVIQAVR